MGMRPTLVLWLIAAGACATSNAGSAIASSSDVPIGTSDVRIQSSGRPTVNLVPFALDRVWSVLPAVLDSLGIRIDQLDAKQHVIGSTGFKAHKRLGKVPLSRIIDCGSTQGFPSADEYDVHLSVLTQVETDKAGPTSIATKVEAAARPMAFAGAYAKCSSKGVLETMIANAVTRQLER